MNIPEQGPEGEIQSGNELHKSSKTPQSLSNTNAPLIRFTACIVSRSTRFNQKFVQSSSDRAPQSIRIEEDEEEEEI
jgi:hypothetical protein